MEEINMSKSSGSQLYIKIVSILNIIGGALYLLVGVLAIFGKNVVGDSALIEQTRDATAPAAVTAFIIALIISGAFSLFSGIIGMRAANDPKKAGPLLTLSVISLCVGIAGIVAATIGGGFKVESLIKLVPPALMTWCANNVKKQSDL